MDEKGNVIYGDMLLLIFGREILSRKPGATFIGEVKCSQVMYDKLAELGGNPIMYKTGHSLIKAKMKQAQAELAGEMSGHMFFADRYYGFDDALYAACRLLEIVANSGKPLSAQLEGVPKTVSTPELRVDCPDDKKFLVVEKVGRNRPAPPSGRGCRWRARAVRARLGSGASFEYAAGIGHALRGGQREITKRIPVRDRRNRGAGEKGSGRVIRGDGASPPLAET